MRGSRSWPIVDRVLAKARELGESLPEVLLARFDVVEAIDEMIPSGKPHPTFGTP